MTTAVIDTNVLLVANKKHGDVSIDCIRECIDRLVAMQRSGIVVIDDGRRILAEYQNKTQPNQPKGVGDVFLKWLLRNQSNPRRVHQVSLMEIDANRFREFPLPHREAEFDESDRKFVAVANAHPEKPAVWQAVDCKWLDWCTSLQAVGVAIDLLCPDEMCRFYLSKFPGRKLPQLPG